MIWADMGLGKTITTLTSIVHLINTKFLRGVIIVAPIRVIRLVWRQEATKWEHTKHLRFSMVTGTKDQRTRALLRPADVYLVNYDVLGWLAETLQTYFVKKDRPIPFNGIVWDEISKMKNSSTNRVKAFKQIASQFDWTTGLTGTPASNGYKDLHGQYLVVDRGVRLGTSKTAFRTRFYRKVGPYKEVPYEDTEDTIKKLIGDITLEMSAEDYNPLPDLIVNNIEIEMPDELREKYDRLEKEFFLVLDSGKEIEAFNQAALTNKCLQFSNGAMYPIAGVPLWEPVHDMKLDALEEIIDEAQGSPILCAYSYRSDAERIMTRFKDLRPINLTECKSEASLIDAMHRWKTGDCQLMIGHPACLAADTQVLTERNGWVKITDVKPDDRVHDGVEFVAHDGCSYSGFKEVIEVFGIDMTPDHKLLIGCEWMEAKDVRDLKDAWDKAVVLWKDIGCSSGSLFDVRERAGNAQTECSQEQPGKPSALLNVHSGYISRDDQHPHLQDMERHQVENARHNGQKLRRSWYQHGPVMERLLDVLQRYVRRVCGSFDYRANRCEQAVPEKQLSMGNQYGTTVQQAKQPASRVQWGNDASCGTGSSQRIFKDDVVPALESGDVCGRGGARLYELGLREKSVKGQYQTTRKTHVYDLVNCGPRHQFLIRNNKGEMFISHNSMGHGIDGLQKNGHILVWYGLNWSLDLYEQFNARVRRQGQGAPVMCHRILMQDTLDQAQALALDEKATTQAGLRNAVKQYRKSKGV